jgi:phenylalanyl-tRNA synthetase beta chain
MKISYRWLNQYIDLKESPEEIGKLLTSTGLEVESIMPFETVKGGLRGLVIGEVKTCTKHPNADKLTLTTVDVGNPTPIPIVCGAPNVAPGQKVVVALPGTTIFPTHAEPFTIKSAKIRGEQSEGMICAEDEIGLGESHAGIIVLANANAFPNGSAAAGYYHIESDFVFEIGLTPNRADAASHLGVGRDLKAALKRTLTWPSIDHFKPDSQGLSISIDVRDRACLRYSGVTMTGVAVGQSPAWLKNRLKSIGLSPVNNVVDITNYVLHETGQPLHAFDADMIKGNKIIVQTLQAGTKFVTLDHKERILTAADLMICNASEGMCIAGVLGGASSGISPKTTNLFIESACFSPASIRKTGMHHQIKTDASFRFERGTDPELTVYALKRAALLIREIAGGQISFDVADWYPEKVSHRSIEVKEQHVHRLIGKELPRETMYDILERLDIQIINKTATGFTAYVPPYRVDILQEADIIEEILRIYGFNNIALSETSGTGYLADFPVKNVDQFRKVLGEMLAANGFYEILTNSLTRDSYFEKYFPELYKNRIEIRNKLSEELSIMRPSMLFSGLEACVHNINRKQKDLKLFEFGKIYWKDATLPADSGRSVYREEERLAIFLTGDFESENWINKSHPIGYYDMSQYVSMVLNRCIPSKQSGIEPKFHLEKAADDAFEFSVKIMHGKIELGKFGKVKAAITRDLGTRQEIFYADLSLPLLFNLASPMFEVLDVPRFPEVRRDLSLVLDKKVTFAEIRGLVLSTEKRLIKEMVAFDVYEGDPLPTGKKSYSLAFTLLDDSKTMTDDEIDKTMSRLMAAFEQKMGALIRK